MKLLHYVFNNDNIPLTNIVEVMEMNYLNQFKVEKNYLSFFDYKITIKSTIVNDVFSKSALTFHVHNKGSLLFVEEDISLEEVMEVVLELAKEDKEYKDRAAFNQTLRMLLNKSKTQ